MPYATPTRSRASMFRKAGRQGLLGTVSVALDRFQPALDFSLPEDHSVRTYSLEGGRRVRIERERNQPR